MADDRTFIKLHDGFDEHPKVAGLTDKAFRTYIEALCYCSRNLTDGRIPYATSRKLATPRVWSALVEAGLMDEQSDGYAVHDYLEHQRSADQVRQLKEARRAAGSLGGKTRAKNQANAKQVPGNRASKDASESNPDTETDTDKKTSSSTREDDTFDRFWAAYPKKAAKPAARRAWKAAVKRADVATIMAGLARYKPDPQFVANPSTWLNNDRWADEPTQGTLLTLRPAEDGFTAAELDQILGPAPGMPQPPSGLDGEALWEWDQRTRREMRAERVRQANAKLGRVTA